jgi:hypothetical protein
MEIVNHENYLIYEDGRVQNKKTKRFLKQNPDGWGYLKVDLMYGKRKSYKIHRLVGLHYIPKVEGKDCLDHIDRDKNNNDVSNLRWVTPSENNYNRGIPKNNKTGYKQISFREGRPKGYTVKKPGQSQKGFKTLNEAIYYRDNGFVLQTDS